MFPAATAGRSFCGSTSGILGRETEPLLEGRLRSIAANGGLAVDSVNRRKDGSQFLDEVNSRLVTLEGASYVLTVARDIGPRREVERRLRESEERFQQVAENAVEWIWEVNRDGRFKYSNPIVNNILGYSPEELIGKQCFTDLFSTEMQEGLKQTALEMLARHEPVRAFVNPNLHKNGRLVILETNGVPLYGSNGEFLGYRRTSRDITMQRALEEKREAVISELQEALDNIKQLKGLIPVCASCKKIRNDRGYWQQVDVYLKENTESDVSHGLCQECADRLYPEYSAKKESEDGTS